VIWGIIVDMKNTTSIGNQAETLACKYLEAKQYKIVERNYKDRFCEIDIVASHREYIVFVEVKYRSRSDFGGAAGSITPSKALRMSRSAQYWLATHDGYLQSQPRIDVITVVGDMLAPEVSHIEDAI